MEVFESSKLFFKKYKVCEEKVHSYIDTVNGKNHDENDRVVLEGYINKLAIKGWAVNNIANELFLENYIKINDAIYPSNRVILRNDVSRVLDNLEFIRSGFLFEIDGRALSVGDNELTLLHVEKNKKKYYVGKKITIQIESQKKTGNLKDKSANELIKIIEEKDVVLCKYYELLVNKDDQFKLLYDSLTWRLSRLVCSPYEFFKKKRVKSLKVESLSLDVAYQSYLENNTLTEDVIQEYKKKCIDFKYKPKISIVIPVYNVSPLLLKKCIDSVKNQIYKNWELCLYDDCSTDKQTISFLQQLGSDKQIKVKFGESNKHISLATNAAIELATGEYIGLLDNDDELTIDALYSVIEVLNKNQNIDFIYSDEDKLEMDGTLSHPYFKCDFNKDLLLSNNYICHFAVIKKTLGDSLGWFRKGFEGSQDHDLFLRISDTTDKIHHIPKVLYHWRMIPGSTAAEFSDKNYAQNAGIESLKEFMSRNSIKGSVIGNSNGTYRVKRDIIDRKLVSIVIPFKDDIEVLKVCVKSIFEKTDYSNYELILVSNNSKEQATFDYLNSVSKKHTNVKWFEYNEPFNYSKINNWAVKKASGEFILLLNNDVEVITTEWLTAMVEQIQRKEVGAVGAKLLYFDNTVQHAGVIIGLGGVAGHSHKHFSDDDFGYYFRASVIQELSACTAACLLIKKNVFYEVGGLNEVDLTIAFNDVDFCLKVREAGYKIIYTPFAKLYHYESKSRGFEDTPEKIARFENEINYMKNRWNTHINVDAFYSPNLTRDSEDFFIKTN